MKWIIDLLSRILIWLFNKQTDRLEQPKTLEDAQTPDKIKSDWNKYITDQLRNKTGNSDR